MPGAGGGARSHPRLTGQLRHGEEKCPGRGRTGGHPRSPKPHPGPPWCPEPRRPHGARGQGLGTPSPSHVQACPRMRPAQPVPGGQTCHPGRLGSEAKPCWIRWGSGGDPGSRALSRGWVRSGLGPRLLGWFQGCQARAAQAVSGCKGLQAGRQGSAGQWLWGDTGCLGSAISGRRGLCSGDSREVGAQMPGSPTQWQHRAVVTAAGQRAPE